MKNYIYEMDKENSTVSAFVVHKIYERPTEQYIMAGVPQPDVKVITGKLNGGFGFNGWTPSFFLYRVKS